MPASSDEWWNGPRPCTFVSGRLSKCPDFLTYRTVKKQFAMCVHRNGFPTEKGPSTSSTGVPGVVKYLQLRVTVRYQAHRRQRQLRRGCSGAWLLCIHTCGSTASLHSFSANGTYCRTNGMHDAWRRTEFYQKTWVLTVRLRLLDCLQFKLSKLFVLARVVPNQVSPFASALRRSALRLAGDEEEPFERVTGALPSPLPLQYRSPERCGPSPSSFPVEFDIRFRTALASVDSIESQGVTDLDAVRVSMALERSNMLHVLVYAASRVSGIFGIAQETLPPVDLRTIRQC